MRMCGITAIVSLDNRTRRKCPVDVSHDDVGKERLTRKIHESLNIIEHRGPDSSGVWISEDERIGSIASKSII